jgi:ubiquinone/menaquinone biosynthesis C-methylase UbiE
MNKILDYDALTAEYSTYRKVHPDVLLQLFDALRDKDHPCILEVGCGTGNYIRSIQAVLECDAWGIDPSAGMLTAAAERNQDVHLAQAYGENLPFTPGQFDFVFNVDVIHHVRGLTEFYAEMGRVLTPGGILCTVTESSELIRTRVPLSSYFPETVSHELERYPHIEKLVGLMISCGFEEIHQEVVRFPYLITDAGPFESRAFSTLHLISEEAFQRGLARLRADLEHGPVAACSHYLMLWGKRKI